MNIRLDGSVVIIDLRVNPANERELLDVVHGLLSEGHRQFVVNLAELKWLDSAGLGGVAGAYTAVMRHGGNLVLTNAPPAIMTLLEHTKLSTIVSVHDSEQEAIESFNVL